jgi:hypothetical protein
MCRGPRLIGTEVSYREHRILGVWGREVRCKSPNLGPPEPKCMVPCCTEFWCFGTMSDTIFTENRTIGSSMGQLIVSDAGTAAGIFNDAPLKQFPIYVI